MAYLTIAWKGGDTSRVVTRAFASRKDAVQWLRYAKGRGLAVRLVRDWDGTKPTITAGD